MGHSVSGSIDSFGVVLCGAPNLWYLFIASGWHRLNPHGVRANGPFQSRIAPLAYQEWFASATNHISMVPAIIDLPDHGFAASEDGLNAIWETFGQQLEVPTFPDSELCRGQGCPSLPPNIDMEASFFFSFNIQGKQIEQPKIR